MDQLDFFTRLYADFNARNADAVLTHMKEDVHWPNGWEGGAIEGREAVKAYWLRQWAEIEPVVLPLDVEVAADGARKVRVSQRVFDKSGKLLDDIELFHTYRNDGELIASMEIEQSGSESSGN